MGFGKLMISKSMTKMGTAALAHLKQRSMDISAPT